MRPRWPLPIGRHEVDDPRRHVRRVGRVLEAELLVREQRREVLELRAAARPARDRASLTVWISQQRRVLLVAAGRARQAGDVVALAQPVLAGLLDRDVDVVAARQVAVHAEEAVALVAEVEVAGHLDRLAGAQLLELAGRPRLGAASRGSRGSGRPGGRRPAARRSSRRPPLRRRRRRRREPPWPSRPVRAVGSVRPSPLRSSWRSADRSWRSTSRSIGGRPRRRRRRARPAAGRRSPRRRRAQASLPSRRQRSSSPPMAELPVGRRLVVERGRVASGGPGGQVARGRVGRRPPAASATAGAGAVGAVRCRCRSSSRASRRPARPRSARGSGR